MPAPATRNLLVIASQCDASELPSLLRLEEAANALDQALRTHGECAPGLPDRSLLYGEIPAAEISARVGEAAELAARQEALLVLALLGHGFTPRSDPRLHFMGKGSRLGRTFGAVDVQKLVLDVANYPGLEGAIVIIDTCMAAGGAPGSLASREQPGGARLAMLMGAGVDQEGYELIFTRSLVKILESGVPDASDYLTLEDVKPLLEEQVRGQDLSVFDWNSRRGAGALRLARNNASTRMVFGRARFELQEALTDVFGPAERVPRRLDASEFAQIGRRLTGVPHSPKVGRALDLVDDLTTAFKTERFLLNWLGGKLTSQLLRRGLQAIKRVDLPEIAEVRDATEYVAMEHPPGDPDCRRMMARFVVAIGREARKDLNCAELHAWARQVDAEFHLNNAVAASARLPPVSEGHLRLIVSLGSITEYWPAQIHAWIQCDGQRLGEAVFPCPARSEAATGSALIEAVLWSLQEAKAGGRHLRRIEIAAPETILRTWCPEELKLGKLLGVQFDVGLRWSKRISPPPGYEWINDASREQLQQADARTEPTELAWLAPEATEDLATLEFRLSRGFYEYAVGLDHPPPHADLLGLLLSHCPIVLWPRPDSSLSESARTQVRRHWGLMPDELNVACKARLAGKPSGIPTNVRAVWDDLEWLDFCDQFTPLRLDRSAE